MKRLIIMTAMYSSRLGKECFLMLELIVLLILANFVLSPFIKDLSMRNVIMSHVPQHAIYRGASSSDADTALTVERMNFLDEQIQTLPGLIGQGKVSKYYSIFGKTDKDNVTSVIFYNDDMIRNTSLPLSEGAWHNEPGTDPCSIYIGGTLKEQYDVGDPIEIQCTFVDFNSDGSEDSQIKIDISAVVAGKLDGEDFYYHLGTPGSYASLRTIGQYANDQAVKIGENVAGNIVIVAGAWSLVPLNMIAVNDLLFFDDSIDTVSDAAILQEANPQLGSFTALETLDKNQRKETLQSLQFETIMLIVLLPLTLLGIGGYSVLMIIRKQRELALYHLCGMSKRTLLFMNIGSKLLLIIPPAALSLILAPNIAVFFTDGYTFNWISFCLCVGFALLVLMTSTLLGALRIRRMNIIDLIRKGD